MGRSALALIIAMTAGCSGGTGFGSSQGSARFSYAPARGAVRILPNIERRLAPVKPNAVALAKPADMLGLEGDPEVSVVYVGSLEVRDSIVTCGWGAGLCRNWGERDLTPDIVGRAATSGSNVVVIRDRKRTRETNSNGSARVLTVSADLFRVSRGREEQRRLVLTSMLRAADYDQAASLMSEHSWLGRARVAREEHDSPAHRGRSGPLLTMVAKSYGNTEAFRAMLDAGDYDFVGADRALGAEVVAELVSGFGHPLGATLSRPTATHYASHARETREKLELILERGASTRQINCGRFGPRLNGLIGTSLTGEASQAKHQTLELLYRHGYRYVGSKRVNIVADSDYGRVKASLEAHRASGNAHTCR